MVSSRSRRLGLFSAAVIVLVFLLDIEASSKLVRGYLPSLTSSSLSSSFQNVTSIPNTTIHNNHSFSISEMEKDVSLEDTFNSKTTRTGTAQNTITRLPKFFIIAPPLVTSQLIEEHTEKASRYYNHALNEESAEIWLHRGFQTLLSDQQTSDPHEADVFLLAGYLHLWKSVSSPPSKSRQGKKPPMNHSFVKDYVASIVAPEKPHLLLIPSWNPSQSRMAGIKSLTESLLSQGVNLWSVGFERNPAWQWLEPDHIVPIPYVVRSNKHEQEEQQLKRQRDFIFYAGDPRNNAKGWAGCYRDDIVEKFQNQTLNTAVDVRLITKRDRLSQSEYNYRMATSEYCLILCGDTPTSRSLTSAIVGGCIPLVIGSRLRGLCEPPCKQGFGWRVVGPKNPHLPYSETMEWRDFPEVNEQELIDRGIGVVNGALERISDETKLKLQTRMAEHKSGWIYGWGDPTNSTDFGSAVPYIYNSFVSMLGASDSSQ